MIKEYRFSLLNPTDKAIYSPELAASSCVDLDYLIRLNSEIFDISLAEAAGFITEALDDERCHAWLIVDTNESVKTGETKVIGCFVLYCTPTYSSVAGFGLLKEARGKGYGMDSINLICSKLPQTVKRLDAHCGSDNKVACSMYQKAGFVILEEI